MDPASIVITGAGVVSSIGIGADSFFDALCAGKSGIRSLAERTDDGSIPHPGGDPDLSFGAPVLDFDPKQYVRPRKSLKVMCREIAMAFASSQLAIEKSCLSESLPATEDGPVKPNDIATVFGGEFLFGPPPEMIEPVSNCQNDDGTVNVGQFGQTTRRGLMPLWMLKYLPNMAACHVGISVNAHGPNNTILQGDVSAASALIEAISCIQRRHAKVAIMGAMGTRLGAMRMLCSHDMPNAKMADPVANSSRPFDPNATGIVNGEGAGTLIIESQQHAESRNAAILAKVTGFASRFVPSTGLKSTCRSNGIAESDQGNRGSTEAIQLAISAALDQAKLKATEIGLIVSHAMGDPVADAAEQAALLETFSQVPVVAPMASIGHTGAASGAIELATAALCIEKRTIPMTLNAEASQVNLLAETQRWDEDHALCLSYSTDGHAVAIVLSRLRA